MVSFNKKKDLALLYIQANKKNHELIKLAKYNNAEIGDDAHAIGHPDGELWTFSTGMIGNIVKKQWKYDETFDHEANLLQIQTPINPGNSGGPLMNDDAELIGVNVMSSIKSENINFAIALDEVKKFINSSARKWNSIKEEIIKPVFPGYIFISINLEKKNWSKVNNTKGISRVIVFGSELPIIPHKSIQDLKTKLGF